MTSVLAPGRTFGRYVVERPLGTGGMGEVVVAMDTFLHRRVALKIVRRDRASNVLVARLMSEARAAAALHHPNIVTLLDAGEIEGVPFLAMEYVEGRTLRGFVGDPSVPPATKLEWMRQVAVALAAAHAAGIVHRDIKPENVIVSNEGVAKILDFGIAKRTQSETVVSGGAQGPPSAHTQHGRVVGTVAYMAPEQHAGGAPSPAWDQYAWGVTAYELVAGARPDPSARLLNEIAPVPFDAAAAIARAMAPSPEHRWPAMQAIVTALQPTITAPQAPATGASTNVAVVAPATPRRSAWPIVVGIALFLLATFAGAAVVLYVVRRSAQDTEASSTSALDGGSPAIAASVARVDASAGDGAPQPTASVAPRASHWTPPVIATSATSARPATGRVYGCDCNVPKVANLCKKEHLTNAPTCDCRNAGDDSLCAVPWTVTSGGDLESCDTASFRVPGGTDGASCTGYGKHGKEPGKLFRCNFCTFYSAWTEAEGAPCSGWSGGQLMTGVVNCAVLKEACPHDPAACAEAQRRGIKVR